MRFVCRRKLMPRKKPSQKKAGAAASAPSAADTPVTVDDSEPLVSWAKKKSEVARKAAAVLETEALRFAEVIERAQVNGDGSDEQPELEQAWVEATSVEQLAFAALSVEPVAPGPIGYIPVHKDGRLSQEAVLENEFDTTMERAVQAALMSASELDLLTDAIAEGGANMGAHMLPSTRRL